MADDSPLKLLRDACRVGLEGPAPSEFDAAVQSIVGWVLNDFRTLPERPVGTSASRPAMEALLREPAPEQGRGLTAAFERFRDAIAPFALRPQHPRFLAFVPGAPTLASILGDWLCAGANYFAGVWFEAAGPAQVELLVLDWLKELLGFPAEACGLLTSGGSEANLTALVVARDQLPYQLRQRAVLYVSAERHWSVDRAARIIGLRAEQVRPIACDWRFRMRPELLESAIAEDRRAHRVPLAVVASAGTTNTGAVDPLTALADVCREQGLWLHVDAAYGWSALLTEEGKRELSGIERADSVVLDPHKWFAQTYEAGCVLVRDGKLLPASFALRPDYMQDVEPGHDEINFADHGIALTRRFRALKIWLSIQALGLGWFRRLVTHCCRLADLAQALLERAGFEIVSPRQLSIICFRYVPVNGQATDAFNLALVAELFRTGQAFLSTTRLDGRVAVRMCFVNSRTTAGDVETIVNLLTEIAGRLEKAGGSVTK